MLTTFCANRCPEAGVKGVSKSQAIVQGCTELVLQLHRIGFWTKLPMFSREGLTKLVQPAVCLDGTVPGGGSREKKHSSHLHPCSVQ